MESYVLEQELKDVKEQLQKLRGEMYGIATLLAAIGLELDQAVQIARGRLGAQESPHSAPALQMLQTLEEMRKEIRPQEAKPVLLPKS